MSDPSESDLQRELNNLLSRDVSSYPQWQDQTTVTSSDLPSDSDYATTLGNFGDEWSYYPLPEPLEDQLFQVLQQPPAPEFDQLVPHPVNSSPPVLAGPSPAAFSENVEPNPENNNTRDLATPNLKMGYHLNTRGRITWLMVSTEQIIYSIIFLLLTMASRMSKAMVLMFVHGSFRTKNV